MSALHFTSHEYPPGYVLSQTNGACVFPSREEGKDRRPVDVLYPDWAKSRTSASGMGDEIGNRLVRADETSITLGTLSVIEPDSLLDDLRQLGVAIPQEHDVRSYLKTHPDLSEIALKAVTAVRKHIADGCLVLDLYSDPEIHDQYLALVVRVPVYDENFLALLEEAEAEYIEQLSNSAGWLQLTTDFQPPEITNAL